jgi:hypothetical protein
LYFFSRRAHITAPFSQVGVSVSTGRNQYIGGYQGYRFSLITSSWPDEDQRL